MPTLEKPPLQLLDTQAAPSGVDRDARTVELSFSSARPIEKLYGVETLSHGVGAVDLSRLNDGGALLVNHDEDQQVGVVERAWIQGGKGRAKVRFGESNQATEIFNDVVSGIRSLVSVGYIRNAQQRDANSPDQILVTNWTPLEISIVSIPADVSVGIGRSFHSSAMKPNESTTTTAEPPTPPVPPAPASRALAAPARAAAAEEIRSTARTVYQREKDHAVKHDLVGLAERAIDEGKSPEEFYKLVRDSYIVRPDSVVGSGLEVIDTPGLSGMLGRSFLESREYRHAHDEYRGQPASNLRLRVALPYERRGAYFAGGLIGVQVDPTLVGHGVQLPTVAGLMQQIATTSPLVRYVRETNFTPSAGPTGEGQSKPELQVSYIDVDTPVVKIATFKKRSDELIWDFPAVAQFIDNRVRLSVEIAEDWELLNGDGTPVNGTNHLTGFLNTPGIQAHAVGADTKPDALHMALVQIQTTAFLEPDAWIFNPLDWQTIRLLKDANNQYLGGGPFTGAYGNGLITAPNSLWGKPVVTTTVMPKGTALAGAFNSAAQIRRRMGMTVDVTNCDQDDFVRNLMTVRAETRLALTVQVPQAFCLVTGL